MDCVILAGGVPGEEDPLHELTQGKPKALLDIAGRPMAQWVVDGLAGSDRIERIYLAGLGPEHGIASHKLAALLPDQGSMLGNAVAAIECLLSENPSARQIALSSADIPLIQPYMVDWLIDQCTDLSIALYYGVVERSVMQGRFPESRRSYVHLREGDFAGGDLFLLDPQIAYSNRAIWDELIGSRKNAFKQARRIGLVLMIKLVLRQLDLPEAERRVSKALDLRGRVVISKYPELAMDVDKPFQWEICQSELARL